jgi:transposase
LLSVQQWAEIRRLHLVEGVAIKEIARRMGVARNTVRTALRSAHPPSFRCPPRPSKLDPFKEEIHGLLLADSKIPGQRIRELIAELGFDGGKTIVDDYLRGVRPLFQARRTYQRTVYRPGELVQFDVWEPRAEIPVGHGQTRRGFVVTCELGFSRVSCGSLVFSKEAPDLLWGMGRCLSLLGGLPETAVWDREGAIAPRGKPSEPFLAFCGQLALGWLILEAQDPQSKGLLERHHRYLRTSFEPARSFASERDYQAQLDAWHERANRRVHRTTRAVPIERLETERGCLRPLPALPDTDRRFVTRVPQQPYLRFDRNDYSLDPRFAGRRVELRASQREITAVVLDTGELACRHRRSFAGGLSFTDPAHQAALETLRECRRHGLEVDVEQRPLARYDQLIPA